jgi:hypothetical protein
VSNLFAALPTHLADPLERLRMIHEVMVDAKQRHAALGPEMLASWAEYAPAGPYGALMRAWSRGKMSDHVRAPINLVLSNVPGPPAPLCINTVRLVSIHSIGPVLEGIGLNVTAWSYVGRLQVAVLACPEHVPDIWQLVSDMNAAHRELLAAVGGGP